MAPPGWDWGQDWACWGQGQGKAPSAGPWWLPQYLLQVAAQFLLAAARPVEAVEGSLHKGGHDAPQPHLVTTAIALPIVLHAQPVWKPGTA